MKQTLKNIHRSGWPSVIVLFILVFAARSVIADWNPVPTGSMKPTILEGDVILVNRAAYDLKVPFTTRHLMNWAEPEKGEIIVLKSPDDGTRLVKRVIAVPGDHLQLRGDTVWLNGKPAPLKLAKIDDWVELSAADRKSHRAAYETLAGHNHSIMLDRRRPLPFKGDLVVPPGHYFVMGDHRNNSRDSRYFGLVERSLILGRAHHVLLSVDIKDGWKPRWARFFQPLDSTDQLVQAEK